MRTTRALIVILIVQMCLCALAQGQSSNMIGRWNVEINFADGNKRSLRFDAQDAGKGDFSVGRSKIEGAGDPRKPSEAKWTRADQNAVTFSGRGGISARQRRPRRGNVDVQRKIRNAQTRSAARWNSLRLSGTDPRSTARSKRSAIILPTKHAKIFGQGILSFLSRFVDTSSLESAHKMVTALLPFPPKTSDANYTNHHHRLTP